MDEVLKIKELSDYLKIPSSTIYKLIQEGKLPAIKLGKHWRILKRDIENLFEKQTLIKSLKSGASNEYKG